MEPTFERARRAFQHTIRNQHPRKVKPDELASASPKTAQAIRAAGMKVIDRVDLNCGNTWRYKRLRPYPTKRHTVFCYPCGSAHRTEYERQRTQSDLRDAVLRVFTQPQTFRRSDVEDQQRRVQAFVDFVEAAIELHHLTPVGDRMAVLSERMHIRGMECGVLAHLYTASGPSEAVEDD